MPRHNSRHGVLAALLVVAVILVAGGTAIASNAGFKFNMPIVNLDGSGGQQGHNWVSLPYFNPYATRDDVCTACGLAAGSSITTIDTGGGVQQEFCGSAPSPLVPGEGIRIIQPAGGPANCIIVGSHDPTLQITLPAFNADQGVGKFWFSVPYHTTAANREQLCTQMGLNAASWTQSILDDGSVFQQFCGPGADAALVLGEALRISANNSTMADPIMFTPAHF
jgi:hypothetical protein